MRCISCASGTALATLADISIETEMDQIGLYPVHLFTFGGAAASAKFMNERLVG